MLTFIKDCCTQRELCIDVTEFGSISFSIAKFAQNSHNYFKYEILMKQIILRLLPKQPM